MKHVICIGEMLIDFIPSVQEGSDVGEKMCYHPHPGGAPANVAVALARLGAASRFIGKFSEDGFGKMLVKVLRDNQVDTNYIRVTKQGLTALALVTLQADGQREFTFYRHQTADTLYAVEELDWQAWQDVAICHAGSVSLSVEPARSATLVALDHTRSIGGMVSFDANVRSAFWESDTGIREALAYIIARTDLLKFSIEEAHYLGEGLIEPFEYTDKDRLHALGSKLLTMGPQLVIVTMGSQGSLLMTATHKVEVPAFPVSAVDTTGAGDAFMGATLYTLLQQEITSPAALSTLSESALHQMGRFANKAASLTCTRYGGIVSLPFLKEFESE